MKYRKLLIIHDSSVVRKLLKGYILSEMSDILSIEARSGEEAKQLIEKERFDVILSGNQLIGYSGSALYKLKDGTEYNHNTPFIIITSSDSQRNVKELKTSGIEHYLLPPVTPSKLQAKIDEVFDPRKLRKQERYNVPGLTAVIQCNNKSFDTKVINISQDSVLGEVVFDGDYHDLSQKLQITLKFPENLDNFVIKGLFSKTLKVNIIDWDSDFKPKKIQVVLIFIDMPDHRRKLIETIIKKIHEHNMKMQNLNL